VIQYDHVDMLLIAQSPGMLYHHAVKEQRSRGSHAAQHADLLEISGVHIVEFLAFLP
jgi:hypothetical protein